MIADGPSGDLVPGVMTEYMTDDWGMFVRSAGTLARFRSGRSATSNALNTRSALAVLSVV